MLQSTLKVDSGERIDGEPPLLSGVTVSLPDDPARAKAALVCLAGGNMNRKYFDLMPADGDDSFSFARAMAASGFVVIAIDHLGLGDSTRPADGYALTPDLLTRANARATAEVLAMLRGESPPPLAGGGRGEGWKPHPNLKSIGVGHSMGAMMTVLQQAHAHQHIAVAVLGFATRGLPEYMPPDVSQMPQAEQRTRLVELVRKTFPEPYPRIRSSGNGQQIYGSANADPKGIAALKAATDCLLPVPAFQSMLPDNVGPEAAGITVPVFIGVGSRDMTGTADDIPKAFSGSRHVTLYVQPDAGHSHFLFPTRLDLFQRLAGWAEWVITGT